MAKANITLYTQDGEMVTEFLLGKSVRKAPFPLWSIAKCMNIKDLEFETLPKGVEAEVALVLAFHSHDTLRTSEVARIVNRDVATVCRALHSLDEKRWVLHVSRGTWKIHPGLVYHGRWKWVTRNGK